MTSVAVISSAVTSIECLKDLHHHNSGSWLKEADEILKTLEEMKKAVYDRRAEAGMEQKIKEMVRLSYESVDAIADSVKPSSSSSSMIFDLKRSGGTKLQKLHDQLKGSLKDFQGEKTTAGGGREKSPDASPPSKKADNPKVERKNSISSGHSNPEKFLNKGKKKNKSDSTTGSDVNKAAGSEPNPESITVSETNLATCPEETTKADLFDRLKSKLLEPLQDHSRQVYIAGESGMGKSTLARKLYNDPDVRKFFQVFCWVPINHNFRIKAVLHILLQQLGPWQEEQIKEMNEIELISQIFDVVKDKSYLLVLDGISALQDWESIRLALPLVNSTRVIITTSSNDFSSRPHHYKILGLTRSETLALLNKEASFDSEVGEAIYHASCGLPLYATILAKSLKSEANNKHLVNELLAYKSNSKEGTSHVLGACYKRLAPKLKPCFLYLGQFPPCQDIQVDKLYLQLVAENLIMPQKKSDSKISPQTLRDYLETLADLKVVRVEEDPLSETGLYKTCRLHDQVREFCKLQGLEEEFIEIVDFESSKQVVGPYTRRLAIYMTKYRGDRDTALGFKGNESMKKISSLLIFDSGDKERSGWPSELNALEDFSHLRVLSFDGVDFRARQLPKGLEKLLLLRYLSFRGCFLEALPSSLCKLTQLETLDLLVRDECEVIIHDTIFNNMKRMVHLYLPRKYKGSGTGKVKLQDMKFMETLINFDTEVFDVKDLSQLKKLKILSTVSNGEESEEMDAVIDLLNERKEELQHSSMEIRGFDFYNQDCVSVWEKLLECRFVHSVQIEGEIAELSEKEDGGGVERVVSEMVLHGSELERDPMGYFGRFQNLRSLVLEDDAFVGTDMFISSSPMFPKLRSLKLRNLQYIEKLTIEEGAVPELSSLRIESCGGAALELTIPKELYHRLTNEIGGDAYSVVPSPSKFITTP